MAAMAALAALAAPLAAAGSGRAATAAVPAGGSPRDLGPILDRLIAAKGRVSDRERLRTLFAEVWRHTLEDNPEIATWCGYPGYNDRWSDLSPAAIARSRALAPKVLAAVESIDRTALDEAERSDYDLFRRRARMEVEGSRFPAELLAINQLGGIQTDVPQISLAQEREGIPDWRRFDSYGAFAEGWGLYAESLGTDLGLYQDPYSQFGRLTNEAWRAIRLVVDTGIHSMGWTRQQAIAEKELGAQFDLRAFHDQVLGRGAVPLDVLAADVEAWVARRKAAAAGGRGER